MTEAIIMGMKVGPRITHTSQSNRGTRGHHPPYPSLPKDNFLINPNFHQKITSW